jgi:glycosyltransferase involved in cell wall biosynthesis
VSSSREEGTPVALIEASAAARPVVSTDVGGVRDVVADGHTGLLVKDRDPATLAAAVVQVLDHPEEARRFGAAGRELVLSRYRVEDLVGRTGALYRALINEAVGVTSSA